MKAPSDWPADNVERRRVADLLPHARNSRTHSPAQVAAIAKSMEQFGVTNPILVDENGTIIAGHGRVLAAKKLGWEMLPVAVASGWTEANKRAYLIADNKLAEQAGWDTEILRVEFAALHVEGMDLGLTGFDAAEIAGLLAPPEEPKKRRGAVTKTVIQFNIVFDDEKQQQAWFAFMKRLKLRYPDAATLGERLARLEAEAVPA